MKAVPGGAPCRPDDRRRRTFDGDILKYGERHLKRAIDHALVHPISNLIATQQVRTGRGRFLKSEDVASGAGLIEAIPDSVIRTWENPTDRNGDGIRGRAALVMDPVTHTMRVGRFGWKAQQATLLAFAGEAFRDEMGITNDLFPKEAATGLSAEQLAACDKVPDPEDRPDPKTHLRGIDQVTNFMRFLAPVEPLPLTENRRRGMVLFAHIGCASCHVPERDLLETFLEFAVVHLCFHLAEASADH